MPSFDSGGVEIAYETEGTGEPVLLIHGFASNAEVNWKATGWFKTLTGAGYRVIAVDNRGHGRSEKLYDPSHYGAQVMAEDAARLLDHLGIVDARVMGYSMGARICAFLSINHPGRVSQAVFAGLAGNLIHGVGGGDMIAAGLEAPSLEDVTDPGARAFRLFAEQTRSDLRALAACMRSSRVKIAAEDFRKVRCPALIVTGELDTVAGPHEPLLDALPDARGVILPSRNHMNAVGDRGYKEAVLEFFALP